MHDGRGAMEGVTSARRRVVPFLFLALISLLLGLWAGLARIGWDMPEADGELMLRHGALMVVGFVGTVIAIERAVAVRSIPAFAAPALSAAAGVVLVIGGPTALAAALATAAGVAFALNTAILLLRHRMLPFAVAFAGGLSLAVAGVVWWQGGGLSRVVPWWIAFLVLTISAERLEFIRFQRFSRSGLLSGALVLLLVMAGPAVTLADLDLGTRLLGIGLLAGALWLVRRDLARHTVRTDGLARFAATGVLTAYAWLAVTGALLVVEGFTGGLRYDAVVHAFFIGFVFSAIIAHAPIIAPAVTGLHLAYTPLLYVPLAVLNAALVLRIAADLAEASEARRWSGMIQALAILLFLALTVGSAVAGSMRRTTADTRGPRRVAPDR